MSGKYDYNLITIGGGPGGYVAAIRAAQLGLKSAVIEKNKPGGVCLNTGCIPTKNFIHNADFFNSLKKAESFGVDVNTDNFDFQKVFSESRKIAETLSNGIRYLLKKNKIDLIEDHAVLDDSHTIMLKSGEKVTADNIIIATGSRPGNLQGMEFDGSVVLSSDDAIMLKQLPESICIVGGGAVGCEFAHIMNAFGVEVHLVEIADQLLPREERETVDVLHKSFVKRGIRVYTKTRASLEKKESDSVILNLISESGEENLVTQKLLVVAGRIPNTEGLGLEKAGVKIEDGFIYTDDYYQTTCPGVYAIGDVVSSPMLAHVASKEGQIAVEHLSGIAATKRIDLNLIPSAVYCEPQIAGFGLTEKEAEEKGLGYKSAVFPFRGVGKAVAIDKPDGMIKILTDAESGEILGVHIAGAEATELIHECLLAKSAELTVEDIADVIHAHPSLSEIVMEGAHACSGTAVHF